MNPHALGTAPRPAPERHDSVSVAGRHPMVPSGERQQQIHRERSSVGGLAVGCHLCAHLCRSSKPDLADGAGAADRDGQGRARQPPAHARADHRHRDAETIQQAHVSEGRPKPP